MKRRRRSTKPKGTRRVSYALVDRDTVHGRAMYDRMQAIRDQHHPELEEARIVLAWCTSWKPDRFGHLTLGKCVKATDLARELAPYDFTILLNRTWWEDVQVEDLHRTALLDHELCHAAPLTDPITGEVVRDERGRKVWCIRPHDTEEFWCIGERYGAWKRDIERLADAIRRNALKGFVPCEKCKDSGLPGYQPVEGQANTVRRCECWLQWNARVSETPAPAAAAS